MSKVSCKVGFVETIESENHPGVWLPNIIERRYYGDMTRCVRRLETGESTNDNVNINNELSLISDPYAQSHIFAIRYVTWQGAKWKVTNVEVLFLFSH